MNLDNFIDVEQNTDDWDELKLGKISGSNAGVFMANDGKSFGEPAKKYARKLAIERATDMPSGMQITASEQMNRGHEQEPQAIKLYEKKYLVKVSNGGFFDFEYYGCSPDGLVDEKGIIEVKSHEGHIFLENLDKSPPSNYKWQLVMNMWVTGADWVDFVLYSAYMPIGKQLFIRRYTQQNLAFETERFKLRFFEFEKLVKSYQDRINKFEG